MDSVGQTAKGRIHFISIVTSIVFKELFVLLSYRLHFYDKDEPEFEFKFFI